MSDPFVTLYYVTNRCRPALPDSNAYMTYRFCDVDVERNCDYRDEGGLDMVRIRVKIQGSGWRVNLTRILPNRKGEDFYSDVIGDLAAFEKWYVVTKLSGAFD